MTDEPPGETVTTITVTGRLDRHAIEAIRLVVRRLARTHGVELRETRPEREATEP